MSSLQRTIDLHGVLGRDGGRRHLAHRSDRQPLVSLCIAGAGRHRLIQVVRSWAGNAR